MDSQFIQPGARSQRSAAVAAGIPLRAAVVLVAVALATLLAGCGFHAVRRTPVDELVRRSDSAAAKGYAVQVGDIIAVKFYFNPELDYDTAVRADGFITLSLIGDVAAAGHSTQELSATITTAYKTYLNQPNATAILRSPNGHRVFVTGEVYAPGVFVLQGSETALAAVSTAGGLTDRANFKQVVLIRHLPGEATPLVAVLDLRRALNGSDPRQDVPILANDIVYVPRTGAAESNVVLRNLIWGKAPFSASANVTYNGAIK